MTPRFRTVADGDRTLPLNTTDDEINFARCFLVPTKRYSVFEGLTTKRFAESQECTESRAVERRDSEFE